MYRDPISSGLNIELLRPAEYAEARLVDAILHEVYPIDSVLPAERDLAIQLRVTRPTLREALQRLARDGWLEIRQGKPTRVRDYWREGSLGVLSSIVRYSVDLPPGFVSNLLGVRLAMAPSYMRLAVKRNAQAVYEFLDPYLHLPDEPEAYAQADWDLHCQLTILSENPIFTLILNGFAQFYIEMAQVYFQSPVARQYSRQFYQELRQAAQAQDDAAAEAVVQRVMNDSIRLWRAARLTSSQSSSGGA
jgi:GntR family transcriptional regulator, negative regulator for fad regulon and positive regulator of fabA